MSIQNSLNEPGHASPRHIQTCIKFDSLPYPHALFQHQLNATMDKPIPTPHPECPADSGSNSNSGELVQISTNALNQLHGFTFISYLIFKFLNKIIYTHCYINFVLHGRTYTLQLLPPIPLFRTLYTSVCAMTYKLLLQPLLLIFSQGLTQYVTNWYLLHKDCCYQRQRSSLHCCYSFPRLQEEQGRRYHGLLKSQFPGLVAK